MYLCNVTNTRGLAFLSYLRLSIYMAIVSIAITLSFHVKHQPSNFELRMAKPLGAVFWALSVVMLLLGLGNYIRKFYVFLINLLVCCCVADFSGFRH